MNVFILNTGRCGSSTFIKACQHINNYSAAHESNLKKPGSLRLSYPANHIEADNRLSWFLGRLDRQYGNNAIYVHLQRNTDDTIRSFLRRSHYGIMKAYREGIYMTDNPDSPAAFVEDYINTVNTNIQYFLRDKTHKMDFNLEQAKDDFSKFWELIQAEGDIEPALGEWDIAYNQSEPD